jgi:F-type H+-transporting ATPase subunit gamma
MSVLELRKQISATQNTRAITKAMQLVAANKMKTFVRTTQTARDYASVLEADYLTVQNNAPANRQINNPSQPTLFLLFASDKGLCGALNIRVMRTLLQSDAWKNTAPTNRVLIAFGRKGHEQAKRLKLPIAKTILQAPENLTAYVASKYFGENIKSLLQNEYTDVYAAHPVYQSAFSFGTAVTRLSNHKHVTPGQTSNSLGLRAIIEPNPSEYLPLLEIRMLTARIIACMAELKSTEYSSRMMAMQKATDSATERIAELTRVYHKTRQSLITQEIAELSTAGEAMTITYVPEISLV